MLLSTSRETLCPEPPTKDSIQILQPQSVRNKERKEGKGEEGDLKESQKGIGGEGMGVDDKIRIYIQNEERFNEAPRVRKHPNVDQKGVFTKEGGRAVPHRLRGYP